MFNNLSTKVSFISLLIIFNFILPFSLSALEENKVIKKYGYFDLGSYYKVKDNGTLDSFDSSFLSVIEEYTPYKFVYVDCGSWDKALQMLDKHEIDMIGTMQWV